METPLEEAQVGSEREAGDQGHIYWPSEYPVALCGFISSYPTLKEAVQMQLGPICPDCAKYAEGRERTRKNPYRQQGG